MKKEQETPRHKKYGSRKKEKNSCKIKLKIPQRN